MKFFTFYSYKGGVGRSMALANVAEVLYKQGKRVVIIDWDLEAPGIEGYFCNSSDEIRKIESLPGLIDILQSYKKTYPRLGVLGGSDLNNQVAGIVREFLVGSTKEMSEDDFGYLVANTFLNDPDKKRVVALLTNHYKSNERDPKKILNDFAPIVEHYLHEQQSIFFEKLTKGVPSFIPMLQLLRSPVETQTD